MRTGSEKSGLLQDVTSERGRERMRAWIVAIRGALHVYMCCAIRLGIMRPVKLALLCVLSRRLRSFLVDIAASKVEGVRRRICGANGYLSGPRGARGRLRSV